MIPPQNPAAPQPEEAGGDEGELVEPEPQQSCEYKLHIKAKLVCQFNLDKSISQ